MDRALLEAHDIPTQVYFEHFLGLQPIYALACGGIQLYVAREDLEKAQRLLQPSIPTTQVASCPTCHSQDFYYNWKKLEGFMDWLLFLFCLNWLIYPLSVKYYSRCKNCDKCFTIKE